jgi:DNA-directed RNA polymerase sigma subunit (sigma70/sigma32)
MVDRNHPERVIGNAFMYLRGHRNARLNGRAAAVIRRRYLNGEATQAALAAEYGCSEESIRKVLYFQTYKDAGVA